MAIFTFTTDLGNADYYVAALKGRIVNSLPTANIVDISNEVAKFDHLKAAYIIKHAAPHFPPKTIHIVGVNDFKNNTWKSNKVALHTFFRKRFFKPRLNMKLINSTDTVIIKIVFIYYKII
jgi:S-adenosylmethionine hydrolase